MCLYQLVQKSDPALAERVGSSFRSTPPLGRPEDQTEDALTTDERCHLTTRAVWAWCARLRRANCYASKVETVVMKVASANESMSANWDNARENRTML